MPPFKDDQIIIIAPGSHSTLAQLGLPESFTPARLRVRSRMFPAEKQGEWEPYKVRRKEKSRRTVAGDAANGENGHSAVIEEPEEEYEEDLLSDEGAVHPIVDGRINNWPCFFALLTHVYNSLSPPFHTPILLIAQPCWTPRDHERLTQFFFEKFKMPAFALMDAAVATCYAYGTANATVIDVGYTKADITAICDLVVNETGRGRSVPECGGEAMTQRLLKLLNPRKFTREMCEQLKLSPICEILPAGTALPGSGDPTKDAPSINNIGIPAGANPAAAASTGAITTQPGAGAISDVPLGPGPDTQVGEEGVDGKGDDEGVLDVASIVASGKMTEYIAQKEKEKQDKAAAKASHKKGTTSAIADGPKAVRLPNSKKDKNTFFYEDHALTSALKDANLGDENLAEARAALDEGPQKAQEGQDGEPTSPVESRNPFGGVRRELTVGQERFQAASGGLLERLADSIFRTVSSVEDIPRRSELWDNLVIVGNGSKVRGFKEALLGELNAKYLVSPSSATIFTSQLPSNLSTPTGTGANTPQPGQPTGQHGIGSGVNPLLYAATAGQNPYLAQQQQQPLHSLGNTNGNVHSAHGQTPTSIKVVKAPEYFPEWKDAGYEEAVFLGAQVAAKVLFVVDQGLSNGFMSRTNYNAEGPTAISEYCL